MKVRIPLMIQDAQVARDQGIAAIEGFQPDQEDFFLDGPISRRVAILDFDPDTGALASGARYDKGKQIGRYLTAAGENLMDVTGDKVYTPEFMQVSVFATVLKTMYLFEKKEVLGRPLVWAFNNPQLLIVPRAGELENAYYHRQSNSVQFFYFYSRQEPEKQIFTCLSRDIVAHETGHAIIDGIVPDLIDTSTPQSLALHEAFADLIAVLMAFNSDNLRRFVLRKTGGAIDQPTAFSTIGEEFAAARGRGTGLRSLSNHRNLKYPPDENTVEGDEPHALSEVLSGALYSVMIKIYDDLRLEYARQAGVNVKTDSPPKPGRAEPAKQDPLYSASGRALRVGSERFQRMIFRALDYFPPGEVSFADYGRAILAADTVAYPTGDQMRAWVRDELLQRGIVTGPEQLAIEPGFTLPDLSADQVAALHDSDWAAYKFANDHRPLLFIPSDGPFKIRPRLRVQKKYEPDARGRAGEGDECIFKVSWDILESNTLGERYPRQRRITIGTTLVLDWNNGQVLARLTTAPPPAEDYTDYDKMMHGMRTEEYSQQRLARNRFLQNLAALGHLKIGAQAFGPDGLPLLSVVRGDVVDNALRVRGTTNLLHIVGGD